MRLNEKQLLAITTLFKEYFLKEDSLWLFGSRADNSKKGGDIDLYVETYIEDVEVLLHNKKKFLGQLKIKIGDQKIDLVIRRIKSDYHLPIYDVAKETGVKII